jgi:hypothetical protein
MMGALIPLLLTIIQSVPEALAALHTARGAMSEGDASELDRILAEVQAARRAADANLDAVLRSKGL